jgi:uncharacterized damage-inducible protein DinB
MSTPASVLREAFERHSWATVKLLDHLETQDPELLAHGVPGTYGPILETLTHLVDADDRYLLRMDEPTIPPYEPKPPLAVAQLRDRVREHAQRWAEMLDRLDTGELHARIQGNESDDPGIDPAETLLLLQALHHGDDHRAQVCSTLGSLGLQVPDLDVWAYWDEGRG